MDRIINSISEIECDSVKIMDEANTKKAEIFAQIQKETEDYDNGIEADTQKRVLDLRRKLEQEMYNKLAQQQEAADCALKVLQQHYGDHHADYVNQLFNKMTGV